MKKSKEKFSELQKARDELKLKAHLFKADVKDEWEELEAKWEKARRDIKPALDAAKEASGNIAEAHSLLLDELKNGYKSIREKLH